MSLYRREVIKQTIATTGLRSLSPGQFYEAWKLGFVGTIRIPDLEEASEDVVRAKRLKRKLRRLERKLRKESK